MPVGSAFSEVLGGFSAASDRGVFIPYGIFFSFTPFQYKTPFVSDGTL